VLAAAVTLWVAGFDVLYALHDIEVDRRLKLHSVPAAVGAAKALWVSRAFHVLAVAALVGLLLLAHGLLNWAYLTAVGLSAGVLIVQQAMVRPGDFSAVNSTFTLCNGTVSLVLGATGICEVLWRCRG
jgi:4-hydroxybenzoate polyprenyltransferase